MGGYPHVAQVITADLDRLGQLSPGDSIAFQDVTLDEARIADRHAQRDQRGLTQRLSSIAVEG